MFNQDLFYKYIEDNKEKTFEYGVWDCFIFVSGYWSNRTKKEYFSSIRKYKTIKGYISKIKKLGYSSISELMDDNFCQNVIYNVKRGDVVLHNECLGLCDGLNTIFLNQKGYGYTFIKTENCNAGYIIDRATNG